MKPIKTTLLAAGLLVLLFLLQALPWRGLPQPPPPSAHLGDAKHLHLAYQQWKARQAPDGVFTVPLGWSKGLSTVPRQAVGGARGVARFNLSTGGVALEVRDLPAALALEAWLVDNRSGGSARPEASDAVRYLGRLQPQAGVATLEAALEATALEAFEVDVVVVTRQGSPPESGGVLFGMPTLFQRLYRGEVQRSWQTADGGAAEAGVLAVGPVSAYASSASSTSLAQFDALVDEGERLFFNETFGGNGRTCGTCHPAENNLTIDPAFIATLPPDHPLFVAEFTPALNFEQNGGLRFENPVLMRQFGLIVENLDGFEDLANKFTMRSVSHVFAQALSIAPSPADGTDPAVLHRTGWSGDGSPGGGTLREFAIGAVIQHTPKTMGRVAGVDFRLPSDAELDALEAFQLSLGRQEEVEIDSMVFVDPEVQAGKVAFSGSEGKCDRCHGKAGANPTNGANAFTNENVDTGVEDFPHPAAALGQPMPRDGGFGTEGTLETGFGNGSFNVPSIIEAADTGPFFHNNAAATLEEAVLFYASPAFVNSPGFAQVNGNAVTAAGAIRMAKFLRVLNTLENIRAASVFGANAKTFSNAKSLNIEAGNKQLLLMREDVADAVRVLNEVRLHGRAATELRRAIDSINLALASNVARDRKKAINKALKKLESAKSEMILPQQTLAGVGADGDALTTEALALGQEEDALGELPQGFTLEQNFPNPFNPTTEIRFTLAEAGPVRLSVFNPLGQEVRVLAEGALPAGSHQVTWDGRDASGQAVATGTYLYQLSVGERSFTRTMTLMK